MISPLQDENTFVRTIYAGNAVMTLQSSEPVKVYLINKNFCFICLFILKYRLMAYCKSNQFVVLMPLLHLL